MHIRIFDPTDDLSTQATDMLLRWRDEGNVLDTDAAIIDAVLGAAIEVTKAYRREFCGILGDIIDEAAEKTKAHITQGVDDKQGARADVGHMADWNTGSMRAYTAHVLQSAYIVFNCSA